MDFSDALRAVKDGQRVRRGVWTGLREDWDGSWLELVEPPSLADGRTVMPLLMVGYPDAGHILRPFAGANWDLLAEDWEVVEP